MIFDIENFQDLLWKYNFRTLQWGGKASWDTYDRGRWLIGLPKVLLPRLMTTQHHTLQSFWAKFYTVQLFRIHRKITGTKYCNLILKIKPIYVVPLRSTRRTLVPVPWHFTKMSFKHSFCTPKLDWFARTHVKNLLSLILLQSDNLLQCLNCVW